VSETYTQIYIAPKIVRTNPRAPLPILFEVCPLIQPEGLRECCKLPQRGPAENAFSCSKTHLWAVIYDLRDLTIARVPLDGVRATQTRGGGIFSRGGVYHPRRRLDKALEGEERSSDVTLGLPQA